MNNNLNNSNYLNKNIFIPSFLIVGGAALYGIIDNEGLTNITKLFFELSLKNFGWLYQVVTVMSIIIVAILTFSKIGKIRLGGPDAKPDFPFSKWFAMTLTGGVSTGLITYAVNEPIIYFGNIYGELDALGLTPLSKEAGIFSIARNYYNWTLFPYAIYSLTGVLCAYLYFNKKKPLTIAASLIPIFGENITKGIKADIIEILSLLAIALGLSSSLGAGLALLGSGIEVSYGIKQGPLVWLVFSILIGICFIFSSVKGLKKGISWLANFNSKIFYVLLIIVFLIGPSVYILRLAPIGLAHWLDNFWTWGLDSSEIGGEALVMWWTLYDWAIWIAYAPLMGIFLATIAYGRTIREFLIVNWLLPSGFGFTWISIWGLTAINWQSTGKIDLIKTITDNGAVAGLWEFLGNIPLSTILVPVIMLTLIISFATNANSMNRTISSMCTKGIKYDEEPKTWLKVVWGVSITVISYVMVTFSGGEQGIDGVKYLAAAGGFFVLFLFILQIISVIKVFFINEVEEMK